MNVKELKSRGAKFRAEGICVVYHNPFSPYYKDERTHEASHAILLMACPVPLRGKSKEISAEKVAECVAELLNKHLK